MSDHAIRGNIIASYYHLKALLLKHRIMLTQLFGATAPREASLIRLEVSDEGIIGVLILDGVVFACTLEHPDLKVASGVYICKFLFSDKFERLLYELLDVPGKTECKFHPGNTKKDTTGCILLGKWQGYFKGVRAVLSSGDTIKKFHKKMNGEDLLLSIYDLTNL